MATLGKADKKIVRSKSIPGRRKGELVSLPMNTAMTYIKNGQAEDPDAPIPGQPMNRMLDTGPVPSAASRRRVGRSDPPEAEEME